VSDFFIEKGNIKFMKKLYTPCFKAYKQMDTDALRESFLIEDLFEKGKLQLYYTDCDRAVVGSACPTNAPLKLDAGDELRAEYFCQRRELGVLNIGGKGSVSVDGTSYDLVKGEVLYISRGSKEIVFTSENASDYAEFYLLSYPAHKEYPTTKSGLGDANKIDLGNQSECNIRTINQAICQARIPSCQLVMGYTKLEDGSVWNTMPSHTHERRSEVYMYYDIQPNECVIHMMGTPQETRHLIVRNKQVVISPSWSIHSGVGTKNYTFCWGMGGENQQFDDMDPAPTGELK